MERKKKKVYPLSLEMQEAEMDVFGEA